MWVLSAHCWHFVLCTLCRSSFSISDPFLSHKRDAFFITWPRRNLPHTCYKILSWNVFWCVCVCVHYRCYPGVFWIFMSGKLAGFICDVHSPVVYFPAAVFKISNWPLVVSNLEALCFRSSLLFSSVQPASSIKIPVTVFLVIFVHSPLLCLSFNFLPSLHGSQNCILIPLSFPPAGPCYC